MSQTIAIVYREQDPLSRQDNVIWALNMLEEVLKNKGLSTVTTASEETGKTAAPSFTIRIGGPDSAAHLSQLPLKKQPESLVRPKTIVATRTAYGPSVGRMHAGFRCMRSSWVLADRIEHGEKIRCPGIGPDPERIFYTRQRNTECHAPSSVNETDDRALVLSWEIFLARNI